jgi:NAD+ diphosphatase
MASLKQNPNTFANNPLDRLSDKRVDDDWVAAQLKDTSTLIVPFWRLQPFVMETRNADNPLDVGWLRAGALEGLMSPRAVKIFLGRDDSGSYFAVDLDKAQDPENEGPLQGLGKFMDLRAAAAGLDHREAAILAQGKSMIDWHHRHGFCSVCGAASEFADGGYKRDCPQCGAEHFPRTDPVVISLVVRDDECLMGRGPQWPKGMFSALAGFLEPGETIEEAVRREIAEETTVKVGAVKYIHSQPWPFPSSLMIGCIAEAETTDVTVDGKEIAEARWFKRSDIKAALKGEGDKSFMIPPPLAIAHQLLRAWVFESKSDEV